MPVLLLFNSLAPFFFLLLLCALNFRHSNRYCVGSGMVISEVVRLVLVVRLVVEESGWLLFTAGSSWGSIAVWEGFGVGSHVDMRRIQCRLACGYD